MELSAHIPSMQGVGSRGDQTPPTCARLRLTLSLTHLPLVAQFGDTKPKPLNRSQLFVPADQVAQEEATEEQLQHLYPHAQGPYGVYPNDTWVAKLDYVTTSSKVAPNNVPDDPTSLASRIAHRRVARTKVR